MFQILHYTIYNLKKAPRIIEAYKNLRSEKSSTDGYIKILIGYARSPFRDFGSYLRIVVGLDEDDIQLILGQYHSNFVTDEISPEMYTIKANSEAVFTDGDHERTLQIEDDDIGMKTKLIKIVLEGLWIVTIW